jgi:ketosteroid isomerase-like protein
VRLHPNIAIVRRFYHAFISRDTQTLWTIAGEDLAFHVPGRSQWAGEHRGREKLLSLFYRLGETADRSVRITLHDIVGGEKHVVGLHHVTATIAGKKPLDLNGTTTCHVTDGKIVEVWLNWESQPAFDEFWG